MESIRSNIKMTTGMLLFYFREENLSSPIKRGGVGVGEVIRPDLSSQISPFLVRYTIHDVISMYEIGKKGTEYRKYLKSIY